MLKQAKTSFTIMAVCGALLSPVALAAEATSQKHAEAATEYRESLFHLLKSNMGPLGAMAKGNIPYDAAVMSTNGLRIEQLADMMSDYLKTDTRKFDVDTEAKDVIWEEFDKFEEKIAALQSAAANLQTVAAAGDESAYRSAIGDVGGACKSCHDDYKED